MLCSAEFIEFHSKLAGARCTFSRNSKFVFLAHMNKVSGNIYGGRPQRPLSQALRAGTLFDIGSVFLKPLEKLLKLFNISLRDEPRPVSWNGQASEDDTPMFRRRPVGRPKCRWKVNVENDLRKVQANDWHRVVQYPPKWRPLVSEVKKRFGSLSQRSN